MPPSPKPPLPDGRASAEPRRLAVYRELRLVLLLVTQAGPLRSSAPPPPSAGPPPPPPRPGGPLPAGWHPWLSGQAVDAGSEAELRWLLDRSSDADAYLAALVGAGYDLTVSRSPFSEPTRDAGARLLDGGEAVGSIWAGSGQFGCLWWMPEPGALACERSCVTAYSPGWAERLLDWARPDPSYVELTAAAEAAGLVVRPLS